MPVKSASVGIRRLIPASASTVVPTRCPASGEGSSEDADFIAWQDTRNGDSQTDAENVYMAAVGLNGTAPLFRQLSSDLEALCGGRSA